MGFAEEHLLVGESVVFRSKLHWIVFVSPLFFVAAGCVVAFNADLSDLSLRVGGALVVFGCAHLFLVWVSGRCSEFVVTNKRVLLKSGIIRRRSDELLLSKVEGIDVGQGIVGRIFGYGTIVVGGTGGSTEPFKRISEPLLFRRHDQEQIEIQRENSIVPVPLGA